ncbi:MAG: M24 family metallopeptidase, partial [Thermoplasmata archaeon]
TIRNALMAAGADAASFRPIAASGPNGSQPHYRFGDRVLRRGDAVVLDFGGMFAGYYTDITRTVFLGKADDTQRKVYELVKEANERAVDAARAGTPAEEVDREARKVITDGGYGDYFIHRTGHGIGLEVHEEPYIVEGSKRPLEEGMAFSVEPGIYLPDRFGVRIENIVLVQDGRARRLDRYPRDLQVISS